MLHMDSDVYALSKDIMADVLYDVFGISYIFE